MRAGKPSKKLVKCFQVALKLASAQSSFAARTVATVRLLTGIADWAKLRFALLALRCSAQFAIMLVLKSGLGRARLMAIAIEGYPLAAIAIMITPPTSANSPRASAAYCSIITACDGASLPFVIMLKTARVVAPAPNNAIRRGLNCFLLTLSH